ncbi:hypothetical protein HYX06_03380 [Candidatus Woesearchaeota archaeon]|nr:hypothetical protein [Candidatus Woesearchaeota archaeon]
MISLDTLKIGDIIIYDAVPIIDALPERNPEYAVVVSESEFRQHTHARRSTGTEREIYYRTSDGEYLSARGTAFQRYGRVVDMSKERQAILKAKLKSFQRIRAESRSRIQDTERRAEALLSHLEISLQRINH